MADPLTIAMGAGTVLSAIGAIGRGRAEKKAARYNAAIAKQNAQLARTRSIFDQAMVRKSASKVLGLMRANYGASGVTMEGSPLEVMEESAAQAKLDELNAKYNGELQALGYMNEAKLSKKQGQAAETASYFNAASTLLMGAGNIARVS